MHRRKFIQNLLLSAGAFSLFPLANLEAQRPSFCGAEHFPYQLPPLKYGLVNFEPFLDFLSLEVHYYQIHKNYARQLNEVLEHLGLQDLSIEQILKSRVLEGKIAEYAVLKNAAGGYYNHCMFWDTITPFSNPVPSRWRDIISLHFGSWDLFEQQFFERAHNWVGSGWIWLVKQSTGNLIITCTHDEDNPLMPFVPEQGIPVLGIDLWEHSYYSHFLDQRNKYITVIWNYIDWQNVLSRYGQVFSYT
ncbi:MAG: superoxide dismutase [Bacteroidia bacterium]|nr:superoxide dismutase [Bacteroidia bacterium]MDW8159121.1 superoxide dismutase [Bacteroidia bacterium]